MWEHWDIFERVFYLHALRGQFVHLTCGTTPMQLLLLKVFHMRGVWWLSGYDGGDLCEPLCVRLDEVSQAVGERVTSGT